MEKFFVTNLQKKKSCSLIHTLITLDFHRFLIFSAFLNATELHSNLEKVLKNNKPSHLLTFFSSLPNYWFHYLLSFPLSLVLFQRNPAHGWQQAHELSIDGKGLLQRET